ncbi:peptide ABC transporter substrate-binding protein [Lacticaseibacillus thailandensis]|nr:peptide ABC transporter substrate-binding protein [Lacticaseibacillus thailandensis]
MMRKRVLMFASALTLGALMLSAWGANKPAAKQVAPKQVLRWTETTQLATDDPAQAVDTLSFNVLLNTQEGLYRASNHGQKMNLALAKRVQISANGKTYKVTLRKAKWSNGEPITAQDFVYGWRRVVDPKTKSPDAFYFYPVENAQAINTGKKSLSTLGITAQGQRHLTIKLNKPVAYFKKLLAWPLFYPQNPEVVKQYGQHYGTKAGAQVYSGPYKLAKWNGTNDSWQLVKNKQYWDRRHVKLSVIKEQVVKDANTGLNLFDTGKVDAVSLSGATAVAQAHNRHRVDRLSANMMRVDMNEKRVPAFSNVNVRRAFSLVVDRQQLVKRVLQNGSRAAIGFTPVGLATGPNGQDFARASKVASGVDYNLQTAKKLLSKGMAATSTKSLNLTLLTSDADSSKTLAEYLQGQFEKLPNVHVTVKAIPAAQELQLQNKGDYDLTVTGWQSVFGDPINFLQIWGSKSSYNSSQWHDTKFDQLLADAENKYGNQLTKRWQTLAQAERLLMKQQATIPLFQSNSMQLLNSKVKNVNYNPSGVPYDWKTTYIAK